MVYTCFLCKWRSDKLPRRSYHKFPSKEELKLKWLHIIGKSNVSIGKRTSLCSLHFEEDCFRYGLVNGTKILKEGSLPTLHLTTNTDNNKIKPPESQMEGSSDIQHAITDHVLMKNATELKIKDNQIKSSTSKLEVPIETFSPNESVRKRLPENNELWNSDWVAKNSGGSKDREPSGSSITCSAHFDDTKKGQRQLTIYSVPKKLLLETPNIKQELDEPKTSSLIQISSPMTGPVTAGHQSPFHPPGSAFISVPTTNIERETSPNPFDTSNILLPPTTPVIKTEATDFETIKIKEEPLDEPNASSYLQSRPVAITISATNVEQTLSPNPSYTSNMFSMLPQNAPVIKIEATIKDERLDEPNTSTSLQSSSPIGHETANIQRVTYDLPDTLSVAVQAGEQANNSGTPIAPMHQQLLSDVPNKELLNLQILCDNQKKKIKVLNKKIRRLQNRVKFLKDKVKTQQ